MFDTLIKSIEEVFVQFSFRRLLYILFLIFIVVSSLHVFDQLTGYTRFLRIDKRLTILERLHTLEEKGIQKSEQLKNVYDEIIAELHQQPFSPFDFQLNYEPIIKFLSSTWIILLIVIYGAIRMIRKST